LAEFAQHYGKAYDPNVVYHRAPFAVDVSEGKTDPMYTAHSYHTKVPHKAIMPAILHYTEPGDLVLDGFAGSGMTGVAAQMCGSPEHEFKATVESEWKEAGYEPPVWGGRRAILSELAPAATFIAANYNMPFDLEAFKDAAENILDEVAAELGWMYETVHKDGKAKGRINFTVWSEVFSCPECTKEVVFVTEALNRRTKKVREEFPCPHCGAKLSKDNLERNFETLADPVSRAAWKRIKLRPALINYSVGKTKYEKEPDAADLKLLNKIAALSLPPEVPTERLPIESMGHGSRLAPKGFTHVHQMFLPRPTQALALLWRKGRAHPDHRIRNMLLFFVEQAVWGLSVCNRYGPLHFSQVNRYLSGVYYVPSQISECSPWYNLDGKLKRLVRTFGQYRSVSSNGCTATTSSTVSLGLPANSIDYVFTDPPFGANIPYADLNLLVESWHRVKTDSGPEATVDGWKNKELSEYQELMRRCLVEFHRVLKPGRWLTMVFHNSSNAVWNSIQEALLEAGFVVADVRTLDKQQGSYRQVTSTAVKQDLIISAYKPNGGLEHRFKIEAGTEDGVWDFVKTHLRQLPIFVRSKDGRAEVVAERHDHLLFDRMVAFHVLRGVTVPMPASEFYAGLKRRFPERDGMHFLSEQTAEYDKKRLTVKEIQQLTFAPEDEASAILWLRRELENKPQTFQELHPKFMKEITGWAKHEKPLELRELLDQNFLCYAGGAIPEQVWTWMQKSSTLRDKMKGKDRETEDAALRGEAKDRWYMPDPNKAGDLEKLRERALLKEFDEYRQSAQKRLKVFRMEAVRAGFKVAWATKDYATILSLAKKLPEDALQEDSKLLMWYDQATTRAGGES
jgi:16S rRNA G966 N2-methylase RsmD